jgi:H+/Cl- antiporter ClcA
MPLMRRTAALGVWLIVVAALAVVFGYIAWALKASWALGEGVSLGVHGWTALVLAFVVTGLLGGGLMWLAFYSSRKGFDDRVGPDED